ncbi:MAG: ATP-binding protein, partial [Gemmatimonadaceae bacterium]
RRAHHHLSEPLNHPPRGLGHERALDPTLYDRAAQVRWILQLGVAVTFTLAMTLLANRLRRPIMRTVAVIWWWQLAVAVNLFLYFYFREVWAEHASVRFLGTFFLHVPQLVSAPLLRHAKRLIHDGDNVPAPSMRVLATWAVAGLITTILDYYAKIAYPEAEASLTFIVSRVIAATPYFYALWPTGPSKTFSGVREVRFTERAFNVAVGARGLSLVIDLVIRLTPWPASSASMLTAFVVTLNLMAVIVFGTMLLFVALEHERVLSLRQREELFAAKLRESQSQRLESLGRMATGVAHDFNNVLSVVVAATDIAKECADDPRVVGEELNAIEAAGRQGMALTRQLLDFARQRPPVMQRFAPHVAMQSLRPICERLLPDAVRFVCEISSTQTLAMDASQFEQVVMNLVVNARDAMPSGGLLTVALTDEHVGAAGNAAHASLVSGPYIRLTVRDTGSGIAPDVLPSIFDPFFTTKDASGGTGLGLATVQRITREHGGDAFVESRVGVGTTIDVWLTAGDGVIV